MTFLKLHIDSMDCDEKNQTIIRNKVTNLSLQRQFKDTHFLKLFKIFLKIKKEKKKLVLLISCVLKCDLASLSLMLAAKTGGEARSIACRGIRRDPAHLNETTDNRPWPRPS